MGDNNVSIACEINFSIKIQANLSPQLSDLKDTKFVIQWSTDYAAGEVNCRSDSKAILNAPINFQSTAIGTLGILLLLVLSFFPSFFI
jgi:hypothetical protein